MTLEMVLSQQIIDLNHRVSTLEYLLDLKLPISI